LPALSVAVHVTVVVPSAKVLPDAELQETASVPSTLSVAVGAVKVTVAPEADVASAVMLDGVPLMTGGMVSPPPPPKPGVYPLPGAQGVVIPGPSGISGVEVAEGGAVALGGLGPFEAEPEGPLPDAMTEFIVARV